MRLRGACAWDRTDTGAEMLCQAGPACPGLKKAKGDQCPVQGLEPDTSRVPRFAQVWVGLGGEGNLPISSKVSNKILFTPFLMLLSADRTALHYLSF